MRLSDYDHYTIGQLVELNVVDPYDIEMLKMVAGTPFRFLFAQDMRDMKDNGYLVEFIEAKPDGRYLAMARSAAWKDLPTKKDQSA